MGEETKETEMLQVRDSCRFLRYQASLMLRVKFAALIDPQ